MCIQTASSTHSFRSKTLPVIALSAILNLSLTNCKPGNAKEYAVNGESCVLANDSPTVLLFHSIKKPVVVRDAYSKGFETITYQEGKDYTIDYIKGTIRRTPGSRIPNYATHVMYGVKSIDHDYGAFEVWSNKRFFVYLDYTTAAFQPFLAKNDQSGLLSKLSAKLKSGDPVRFVWYGNSITSGREASRPELAFTRQYEHFLRDKYPKSNIQSSNVSIPGYGSKEALEWFAGKFENEHPDVVFIGFAMNDHNKSGIEPAAFESNIDSLVHLIKNKYNAEVVLFSAFPPNDKWSESTHRMNLYADAAKKVASETKSAYVDIYGTWMNVLKRKDQSSLLANNINHPNDFGHWLYEQAFEAINL